MTLKNDLIKELEERKQLLKNDIENLKDEKAHIIKLKKDHKNEIKSLEDTRDELLNAVESIQQKIGDIGDEISKSEEVRDMLKSQVSAKQKQQGDIDESIKKDLAIWNKLQRGADKLVVSIQDSEYEVEFMNGDTTIFTGEELIDAKVLQVSIDNTIDWKVGDQINVEGKVGRIIKVSEQK